MRGILIAGMIFQTLSLTGQQAGRGDVRFLWYNVENLFDVFDDSLTADEEFTPSGSRHWTWNRFDGKVERIGKLVAAAGGWRPPELIGLAEVENDYVLYHLCGETPLSKYNYRWIHGDSPDPRGMDVALLYLPEVFRPLHHSFHHVETGEESGTRDILYVKGLLMERDTLHILLNHWPSRWEGVLETKLRRQNAARCCRNLLDSIRTAHPAPAMLVAGDFNDEPGDHSIRGILQACPADPAKVPHVNTLVYCLEHDLSRIVRGTLKYRGRWFIFDHMMVSGNLLGTNACSGTPGRLRVSSHGTVIFKPPFLLENDTRFTGVKPFRTWSGYRYTGGFSDHLPVWIDLEIIPD